MSGVKGKSGNKKRYEKAVMVRLDAESLEFLEAFIASGKVENISQAIRLIIKETLIKWKG